MAFQLLLLGALLWGAASALCPPRCVCQLDTRGRRTVTCKEGGLTGPLVLTNMTLDIEVLRITAPEDNLNLLTMSPVFQQFKQLEEIYITRSNIPQLGMHFFYGLNKLDILDLSQNNITQPLDHNFRGLLKLKELYLDDNRIYSLPSGTFRYLGELKVLSIQRNRISELMPRLFLEIRKLKVLKLSGNNLKEFNPVVFEDVQELKSLECRSCGLTKIDKEVYELLHHLIHLDIGDNSISTLTPATFSPLTSLKHLKLDGNHLTALTPLSFSPPSLRRLNLSRNPIRTIHADAFANLHNLTDLNLSHLQLEKRVTFFLDPLETSLEVFTFAGNHIDHRQLHNLLRDLILKELNLSGCGLVNIPYKLFPDTLEVLDLANNHLAGLEADVVPAGLHELDLSNNRFRGLDSHLLEKLDGLRSLKLGGNPWSCDLCHIVPLLERVNRSAEVRDVKCHQPYSAKGKRLEMLRREELGWCSITSYKSTDANFFLLGDDGRIGLIAAGTSVCLLILTVLVIFAALCYSRRHAAKYYTHEEKMAIDGDGMFDNHSPLFCDDRELSFKFPLEEKKMSIATIDEIKKELIK